MQPTHASGQKAFIESAIALLLLLILLYALYNTISLFLGVFAFSAIFAVSFFALFEKLVKWVGNRRKLAAAIFATTLLLLIAVPSFFIISSLVNYLHGVQQTMAQIRLGNVPPLPEHLASIPFFGNKLTAIWAALEQDPEGTLRTYEPQIKRMVNHLLNAGGGMLASGLEMVLGIIISATMLGVGIKVLDPLKAVLGRLVGPPQSLALLDAAGRAIKGVAFGVMGTGFIAALAAYLGYVFTPISIAAGLAALTFFLVVIQIGPLLVWLPVTIWFASQGETGWAIYSGIFGLVVLTGIDNILKPWLIGRSGKLPILVLFIGVAGGMATWGFTGMFKGAIILAVFYTLFQSWFHYNKSEEKEKAAEIPE